MRSAIARNVDKSGLRRNVDDPDDIVAWYVGWAIFLAIMIGGYSGWLK